MTSLIKTTALNFSEHPPSAPAPTAYGPRLAGAGVVRIRDRRVTETDVAPEADPDGIARVEQKIDQVAAEVRALRDTVADHGDALARVEAGLREVLGALVVLGRVPADVPTDAQ